MKSPRLLLRLFCLVGLLSLPVRLPAALWTDFEGDPAAWKLSPWFGYFLSAHTETGWIYHYNHGWWFALGDSEESIWFYSNDLGWIWTGRDLYPYLYQHRNAVWLSYLKDTMGPRWFFDCRAEAWFSDEAQPAPAYTSPESITFTALSGQPTEQTLSDGTAARLPALTVSLPLTLGRESNPEDTTPDGLETSGSLRTISIDPSLLTVDHLAGAALTLSIPAAEAGTLDDETLLVARQGLVFQPDGTTAVQTLYLSAQRDALGNLVFQDAHFVETLTALLYQRDLAPAPKSRSLAQRNNPADGKIKYLPCTFKGSLNWMRPPRLLRMIPQDENAIERAPLDTLTPELQAEEKSRIVQNVIVLVHGHNEEERSGRAKGTTRGPWWYSYKQDVWTPLYAVYKKETREMAENGGADFRDCTRFYEFIYPTYKGIFDNPGDTPSLDIELAKALAQELQPQLTTGQPFNLILIAHSMGGLVSRAALQQIEPGLQTAFKKLITWGTPHLGAELTTMRYAFDAQPGYSFFFNEPRWLSNLRMLANPVAYLKASVAEYLLRAGVRWAVNDMALDTPGTRDLRFVRTPPGEVNEMQMDLDSYFVLGDGQDTEVNWPQFNLDHGSWLYNANLMHLNNVDRYKMTDRYVFLFGVTSHRAVFTPQVYWPPIEMTGGVTGLGATIIPWLVENPDLPYQGFTRSASDGAVSLPSMCGHGLTNFAFFLDDVDHEEYFGAPIAPGAFTRMDLAMDTAWTTFYYLLTDDPEDGGNELGALAMPPFTEETVRLSDYRIEDGNFVHDLGYADEMELQLTWTWPGDDSPVNRIHPSTPIHALLSDPLQPDLPPVQLPVNLFSIDGDKLVSGKIDLTGFTSGRRSVQVLLPLRDNTTFRSNRFLIEKRPLAGNWRLQINYFSPDANAFLHPNGTLDLVVSLDAEGHFAFRDEHNDGGTTSLFEGTGRLFNNRLSIAGTHTFSSHFEEQNELQQWKEDQWVTVYQDITRDEAFASSYTITGTLDPDWYFSSLKDVVADGLYNGSYRYAENLDGATVKENSENPSGTIEMWVGFSPIP